MKILHIYIIIIGWVGSLYAVPVHTMPAEGAHALEQIDLDTDKSQRASERKKKKRGTSTKKAKKKASTAKRKSKRQVGKRSRVSSVAHKSVATRVAEVEAGLQEREKIEPLPLAGRSVAVLVDREPVLMRFRRGDTSLDIRSIESLYFGHESKVDEYTFLAQIETEADAFIRQSKYREALKVAQRGLWRNPMHLGLLKRACELTHHEGLKEVDKYVWQLAELMHLISKTGDGKTPATAYRVMSRTDAILYETEWLMTPQVNIIERRETVYEDKPMLAIEIKGAKGQPNITRYYSIRQ